MTALFVDTSAFLALADRSDRNHAAARRYLKQLARERRSLVTSTDVFDETVTIVRLKLGHDAALALGESLRSTRWCRLLEVSEDLRSAAWQIFSKYRDQSFSFTDCTSFALMRAMGLTEAFTFDRRDFSAAGVAPMPR